MAPDAREVGEAPPCFAGAAFGPGVTPSYAVKHSDLAAFAADFSQQVLRAPPLGKSFLHVSPAVSHHLGNMFQHMSS